MNANRFDENERLRKSVKWKRPPKPMEEKLGDTLAKIFARKIEPRQKKQKGVAEYWNDLLPQGLKEHCRAENLNAGILNVVVDSPVYANELQWCQQNLLENLQKHCPKARIIKIKTRIGKII
ncbi:MAG: DUF721 domain-containing protein [Phycisphaerae bacterium]|nr:DUF721 domain-containing protein [Phycisphaerae bacterium]